MKNVKKNILLFGAITITLLMVSSATAVTIPKSVPQSDKSQASPSNGIGKIWGLVYIMWDFSIITCPGATITIKNPDTGITYTTYTGPYGLFSKSGLPLGHYTVRAYWEGYTSNTYSVTLTITKRSQYVDICLASWP